MLHMERLRLLFALVILLLGAMTVVVILLLSPASYYNTYRQLKSVDKTRRAVDLSPSLQDVTFKSFFVQDGGFDMKHALIDASVNDPLDGHRRLRKEREDGVLDDEYEAGWWMDDLYGKDEEDDDDIGLVVYHNVSVRSEQLSDVWMWPC